MSRSLHATVQVEGGRPPLAPAEAGRFLRAMARRLMLPRCSVGLLFADDDRLRGLNRRYRRKDRPTDVLSFAAAGPRAGPAEGDHLGDIVISSQRARQQGRRRGHGAARETRILLIHGFLHLLGYDHEKDDGQMDLLERALRWELTSR